MYINKGFFKYQLNEEEEKSITAVGMSKYQIRGDDPFDMRTIDK